MSEIENQDEGIATLRDSHARLPGVEAANAALARENTILRAGVDTSTPLGAMFARAYDGPLTVEDMRKAAVEVGALAPPTPPTPAPVAPESTATPEEIQGALDRQRLASGAPDSSGTTPPPPEDFVEAGYKEFHDIMAQGRPREQAAISVIGRAIVAGAAGNPRVILPNNGQPAAWAEEIRAAKGQ